MEFTDFIERFRETLHNLFNVKEDINELSVERGLPDDIFNEVMDCEPLSVFIPEEHGGRGGKTHEALKMLETSSYESLSLSLMMGINGALFLQPVANYGDPEIQENIFRQFMEERKMGGLMITEPDFGSDALRMETSYQYDKEKERYRVKGVKHWAGLTGHADFWLITARRQINNGNLGRDIGFFVHQESRGGIEVEEYYKNLGLYMLPYGRNKIDITVPEKYKLKPRSTGIKMMLDVLHRSRLQFPGMGIGFLKRMLDEAMQHCRERIVGGQSLINYDQVKERLSRLQAYFTISSAMCAFTTEKVSMDKDVSGMDLPANSIKTLTTDMMQQASQSLLQLMGAKGYRLDHIAGRSLIDSRPFQIFEGSNDILYQQISESVLKRMRKFKTRNLYEFLEDYKFSQNAAGYLKDLLNFRVDENLAQHRMIELGRVLSRVLSMEFTLQLGEKGFNRELIAGTMDVLRNDIERIMTSYHNSTRPKVIDYYEESSSWLKTVAPQPVHS